MNIITVKKEEKRQKRTEKLTILVTATANEFKTTGNIAKYDLLC